MTDDRRMTVPTGESGPTGGTAPDTLEADLRRALAPDLILIQKIGEGAMGSVFRARDPTLKRDVAVKVLSSHLAEAPHARARFFREAETIAAVSHPNVIPIYKIGELPGGIPYFVMQFVYGRNLGERIEETGPLTVAETRRVLAEMASALAAAHGRGIIHRDIKTSNALYDDDTGRVLVTDFGIAALSSSAPDPGALPFAKLTQTGAVIGTPAYMSPEQSVGEPVTEATDVYSLGIVAYELLLGRGPFAATTPQRLMVAHASEVPVPLSELRSDVDPELSAIVERCLAKQPEERPHAEDVAHKLDPAGRLSLEWPPPGLDTLRGAADGAAVWLFTGSLFLLGLLAVGLSQGELASDSIEVWLLLNVTLGLVGGAALLWGITLFARMAWYLWRGSRLGHGWLTLFEVVADCRGDAGRLLSGSREYAVLTEDERTRVRIGRVMGAGADLLVGVLPLPLAALSLALMRPGSRSLPELLLPVAVPVLGIAVGGFTLRARGERKLRPARKAFAHRQRPSEATAALVPPWREVLHRLKGDDAPGSRLVGRSWLGLFGPWVLGVTLLAGIAVVGLLAVLGAATVADDQGAPMFLRERSEVIQRSRWLRLEPNSSMSLPEANEAWAQLIGGRLVSGDPPRFESVDVSVNGAWTVSRLPDSTIEGSALLDRTPLSRPYRLNAEDVVSLALAGLTKAEVEYLRGFSGDPRFEPLSRFARAPAYSPMLGVSFGRSADYWDWDRPIPRTNQLRVIAYHRLGEAGFLISRGNLAEAEELLRELVTVGVLIVDGSPFLIESSAGASVGRLGLTALEHLYSATGETEKAARIRAAISEAEAAVEDRRKQWGRDEMMAVAADSGSARAIRWEYIAWLSASVQCRGLGAIVAGPTESEQAYLRSVRGTLVRNDGENEYFQAALEFAERRAPERAREARGWRRALVWASEILHNPRILACSPL